MDEESETTRMAKTRPIADMVRSPSSHMSHYSNLADFHSSAAKEASACERALGDIWKAQDGLPYLERQLEEAKSAILLDKLGEPNTFNAGYIAGVKRIADLMDQIFAKHSAIAAATKKLQENHEALQATWNLISTWYVEETARAEAA